LTFTSLTSIVRLDMTLARGDTAPGREKEALDPAVHAL
jgi:hypothetical protein